MEEDVVRCQIKGLVILRSPLQEEGGRTPKKVTQCKRLKFGGRRVDPARQYNVRGVQLGESSHKFENEQKMKNAK